MDHQVGERLVDLVLLDIDGVLTDGRVSIGADGTETKRIAFDDIDGVFRLKRGGFKVGFITGESTAFCEYVERRFAPDYFVRGCKDKVAACEQILRESGLAADRVAFVGDSVHDVPLLRKLRLSFAPADAPPAVRAAATVVLAARRGEGVIMELADWLRAGGEQQAGAAAEWRDVVDALSRRRSDGRLMDAVARARAMVRSHTRVAVLEITGGHGAAAAKAEQDGRAAGQAVVCVCDEAPGEGAAPACHADVSIRAFAGDQPLGSVEIAFIARLIAAPDTIPQRVARDE